MGGSQVVESTTHEHLWSPEHQREGCREGRLIESISRGVHRQKWQAMPYAKAYQLVFHRLARLVHRHNAEVHSASGVEEPFRWEAAGRIHRFHKVEHHSRGFKRLQNTVEAEQGPLEEYATRHDPGVQQGDTLEPPAVVLDGLQGVADPLDGCYQAHSREPR